MRTYYDILEICKDASPEEIKIAYKKLAKKYHPDKHEDVNWATEYFKEINIAYQVLSDPSTKMRYDWGLEYFFGENVEYEEKSNTNTKYSYTVDRENVVHSYEKRIKEEVIVTKWVVSLIAFFVVIVIGLTQYNDYQHELEKSQMELYKLTILQEIESLQDELLFSEALDRIESSEVENPEMSPMVYELKKKVIIRAKEEAKEAFDEKLYDKVLYVIEPLKKNRENFMDPQVNFLLAKSYKKVGIIDKAMGIFHRLIKDSPHRMEYYVEVADVYATLLNDKEAAMKILNEAIILAIEKYENRFGDAYPVILSPMDVSDAEFSVFYERSKLLFIMGKYKDILNTCSWMEQIRPNNPNIYKLKGKCLDKLGLKNDANIAWKKGIFLEDEWGDHQPYGYEDAKMHGWVKR